MTALSHVQALPGLSDAAVILLGLSRVSIDQTAAIAVLCPAGTTFDTAEALRLELVDRTPIFAVVDVQIAPSPPGTLTPEDEAGARLFAAQRAERLAPKPPDDEAFPWDEPEGGAS